MNGANETMGADTIPIEASGTIELQSALPSIFNVGVSLVGPGSQLLTITRAASAPGFRIFDFMNANATLSGLTISGGADAMGAGILNLGGSLTLTRVVVTDNEAFRESSSGNAFASGAGILTTGPLTLRESLVSSNAAEARGGEHTVAAGGGIEATGAVTVERSTVSDNSAQAYGEEGSEAVAEGGGLLLTGGPLAIKESTVSGNSVRAAEGPTVSVARGGGLVAENLVLTSSTITGNSAEAEENVGFTFVGGANIVDDGTAVVSNTIVADPLGVADSCGSGYSPGGSGFSSGGFNIDEDGSCGLAKGSDLSGADPGLDPVLKDNGGPTPTHALLPGSVAIDRGNSFGATIDQRGLPRPSDFASIPNLEGGDGSDIGAFELQVPPAPQSPPGVAVVSLVAGDRTPPNTRILRGPSRVTFDRLAKFHFNSTEAQSSFQCKVDKRAWKACRSPYKRRVSAGAKHLFKVRAIDRFGNVDPTPARFGWRVKALGG
jgi:hypothetical protein